VVAWYRSEYISRCEGQCSGGIEREIRNKPVEGDKDRGRGRGNVSSSASLLFRLGDGVLASEPEPDTCVGLSVEAREAGSRIRDEVVNDLAGADESEKVVGHANVARDIR
jgi:hypothetical protein